ncbi:MAG: methyltransferase domain-containing protein [Alphaproteobacteria bacterium]|nr:methyltransferase domain-containing protein [Alphaproteobacteria bacterium]
MTERCKALGAGEKVKVCASVGDSIVTENAGWTFGGKVAESFDGHVAKSVPLYNEGHDLVCKLSDYFLNDSSIAYEIGTSTGVLLGKLVDHNKNKKVSWVGIDCEENMIAKAKEKLADNPNVQLEVADINLYDFEKSDLIVSYYCLQFVRPKYRQELFKKIYDSLNWGGALILFEKVRGPDARFQDIFTTLYSDYKLDQGYSPSEIVGKTRSLKGVLEPFSTQGNIDMLKRAGFVDIVTVMKYLSFEGFLAIK